MAYGSYRGGVWSEVDVGAVLQDPSKGLYVCNHFDEVVGSVKYTITNATGSAALLTTTAGGILRITTTTTDDQGGQIQEVATPLIATALRPIYFEGRVKFSAIDDINMFFGLATSDTTVMASGAISATEFLGVYMDATSNAAKNGYLQFRTTDSGTTDTLTASELLLAAAVWLRIGMKIDLTKLEATIEIYNETTGAIARKVVTLTAANVPNAACCVSLGGYSESGGGTPVAITADWDYYRYFQPS